MTNLRVLLFCLLGLLLMPRPAQADEVEQAIDAARSAYQSGDLETAEDELDFALGLLKQIKGDRLAAFLPAAPEGWTEEGVGAGGTGATGFLGGVEASRTYRKANHQVTVMIVADSPALQGFLTMTTNPTFAAAQGGRIERVARQKAVVVYDESRNEGQIMIAAGRNYVTVEGRAPREALIGFAEALDFAKLKAF